jgi:TonB family protein
MNKHTLLIRYLAFAGIIVVSCLSLVNCSHQITEPENDVPPPDFVDYDTPPRAVRAVIPVYPDSARQAGLDGDVWVKLWIDKQGKVRKAVVQHSTTGIFNQPCLDAAVQWLFRPAMKNGRPVDVWFSIPFEFRSNGDAISARRTRLEIPILASVSPNHDVRT